MTDGDYKITIEGPETKVSRAVDEEVANSILTQLLGGGSPFTSTGQGTSTKNTREGNKESESSQTPNSVPVNEFMAGLNIDNNVDRIAAVALYLRDQLGQRSMNKDEIANWFQKSGQAAPKNLPRDIQSAVKKNLIAEDNNEGGQYFVTNTGENALRNTD